MKRLLVFFEIIFVCALIFGTICHSNAQQTTAKPIEWKFQAMWPPGIELKVTEENLINMINKLSGGRLKIRLYPGGALVKGSEVFDAVSKGVIDAGGDVPQYWAGINSAFELLGTFPMIFNAHDWSCWVWEAGGKELWKAAYAKHNIVSIPAILQGAESGFRSRKPIYKKEDFKGLKIRCGSPAANDILRELGASPVMIAGGEVYTSLERGVIDAAEFSNPAVDWGMGLQEVTKYWVSPGWHQPSCTEGLMINKKSWDALPDDLKYVVEQACYANWFWSWTAMEFRQAEFTKKFIDKGIKITRLDDQTLNKMTEISWNLILKRSKENPAFAKIAHSQLKYLNDFALWRNQSKPFTFGQNLEGAEGILKELEKLPK